MQYVKMTTNRAKTNSLQIFMMSDELLLFLQLADVISAELIPSLKDFLFLFMKLLMEHGK